MIIERFTAAQNEFINGVTEASAPPLHLWMASVRGGKSLGAVAALLEHSDLMALRHGAGLKYAVVGRTLGALERNLLPYFYAAADWYSNTPARMRRGASPRVEINGNEYHLFGGGTADVQHRIQGMTCAGALIDEAPEIDNDMLMMTLSRVSLEGSRVIMTGNKGSPMGLFKREWYDRIERGEIAGRLYNSTQDDNPFLAQQFKENLSQQYRGHWRARLIENQWAAAEGLVFPVVERRPAPVGRTPAIAGVDYGDSGITAAVMLKRAPKDCWVVAAEYEWDNSICPKNEVREVDRHVAEMMADFGQPVGIWYVDHANPIMIRALRRRGQNAQPANKQDIMLSIQQVNSLLQRGKVSIDPDGCDNLLSQLDSYTIDPKTEKPRANQVDHLADAFRYAARSLAGGEFAVDKSSDIVVRANV